MGRGLSQQQRDILGELQRLDRQQYANLPPIWSWEEYRGWEGVGYFSYGVVLLNINDDLIESLNERNLRVSLFNSDFLGLDRELFVQSPKVHCLQSSFRRSLQRLRDRGYVQLKGGFVKLTQLGVDFTDFRCDDDKE